MGTPLSVLIVEDSASDAALMVRRLQQEGFDVVDLRVESAGQMRAALGERAWDAVLSDFKVPGFGAGPALKLLHETGLDLPFILVSGTIGEEAAVELMKAGAHDYVMKDHMARLGAVVRREIAEAGERRKRREAESALRASEERFRHLTGISSDFYWETDVEHRLTQRIGATGKSSAISVLESGAQLGKRRWEMPNLSPDAAGWSAHQALLDAHRPFHDFELSRLNADGSVRFVAISGDPVFDAAGVFAGYRGVGSDITERKRAERALRESEAQLTGILESTADGILAVDDQGKVIRTNRRFAQLWRIPQPLLDAGDDRALLDHVLGQLNDADAFLRKVQALYQSQNVDMDTLSFKDGRAFERYSSPLILDGASFGRVWSFRDVTVRRLAEIALRESEERFRGLVEQSLVGIFITDGECLRYCNPRAEEIVGYQPGELAGARLESLIADADYPAVAGEIRRLMSGEVRIAKLEFRARRKDGGEVSIGAQGLRAQAENRPVIVGVLQDISEKRRAEDEIKRYVTELENAFTGTVAVTMSLSEMHDPYTAGHERRVAEIAVALGAELGFDTRRQEGLRVAGQLHDLGKIIIPAEILSKPGKLSAIEFQLVQSHAQASHDVLKDVKFPWPVAEIALQHHERMDGSGYPRGLKGDAILLEARVIAVADVVEAMASHRPYRPTLGIDAALAEIERGRGGIYDSEVADACLKLFREKGYTIPA